MEIKETIFEFVKELGQFDYDLSCTDHVWNVIFPDRKDQWHHLHITLYRQTYYLASTESNACGLEVVPGKSIKIMDTLGSSRTVSELDDLDSIWGLVIASARAWLKTVNKDWIKANKRIQQEYPLDRRYGIVSNALIRASLAGITRLDKELGKAKSRKFIRLVEEGYFLQEENAIADALTTKEYFEYCRIAYIAGQRKGDTVDENLSGREMYERYADGRHEGLLDIDANSKQAFADWIDRKHPKRTMGGHPWEIKRGGNTTHISLSVSRPLYGRTEGFKIELCGATINRLVETIKMFLAIKEASLPITIADPEGIRKRLQAQDNIGIVPCYDSLHRANQHFLKEQCVYDVLYYDDLGRYKHRITPFVTWDPLPVLKPKQF